MKRMRSLFTLMNNMHWATVTVCKQVSIRTSGGSSTRSTHQVKPQGVTLPDCKRKKLKFKDHLLQNSGSKTLIHPDPVFLPCNA